MSRLAKERETICLGFKLPKEKASWSPNDLHLPKERLQMDRKGRKRSLGCSGFNKFSLILLVSLDLSTRSLFLFVNTHRNKNTLRIKKRVELKQREIPVRKESVLSFSKSDGEFIVSLQKK